MNDLKFAFRQLLKNPGFTAVAVLTLALGIGANTAIFSVVNGVLIRALPFPASERLVMIHTIRQHEGRTDRFESVVDPEFKEWTEQNHVFDHMAAYGSGQATLLSGSEPQRIGSAEVTMDFFSLLGVKPLFGRTFVPEEHQRGGPRAVMLSEGLWRDRFGANPSVIGRGITLDGRNVTVVGVLPGGFHFPADCEVWTSLVLDTSRGHGIHCALARLKPDVTLEQAQAEMDAITQRLAQTLPAAELGNWGVSLVVGFNFALSLLTGVVFGVVPAWQVSRTQGNEPLKEGGRSQSSGVRQRFLRQALVAAEIAVSIVLLIGAGLMLKSFARLREVKLGFDPERTLTLNLYLPNASYPSPERIKAFYREALSRVSALPGVRAVGFANAVPLGGGGVRIYGVFAADGLPASETLGASKVAASPDYFRALGIPLLKGRFFTDTDDDWARAVAIINDNLARRLWPNDDPLGKRIQLGIGGTSPPWLEVVGVVGDVRQDDLRAAPPAGIFVPYQQVSHTFFLDTMTFVLRAAEEPRRLAVAVRKTIQTVDPTLPVFDVRTMDEWVSLKVAHPRFNTWLLGSFSAIALALALVGIYGVVSYGVTQRTQEIGIRLALGARGQEVVKMVVRQGMRAVLIGVLCGTAGAIALTRFLTAQLYSVTPTDPLTFASVVLVFIGVALAACLVPALRAARIDPMEALRYE